eukprot:jgi/Mesvir1/24503/Mv21851-RA.1
MSDHIQSAQLFSPRHTCQTILKEWTAVSPEDIAVEKISGGITNQLLKLSTDASRTLEPVLVRIFGADTEVFIDRDAEQRALPHLNAAGFGAQVLGTFKNGRLEVFLPYRTCNVHDMAEPAMAAKIASLLAKFHALPIPGPREVSLWGKLRSWLQFAKEARFDSPEQQATLKRLRLDKFGDEIDAMEKHCGRLTTSRVVYCHNDLLAGNILHDEATGNAQLIDFEYGAYNHRGFDLGNHFNEYAGFECDWSLYPSQQAQQHFARHYLAAVDGCDPQHVKAEDIDSLVLEANCFGLVSHMFWGLWAIGQAAISEIDFDYLGYSTRRWDAYFCRKDLVLNQLP